jgi:hypothetical protein
VRSAIKFLAVVQELAEIGVKTNLLQLTNQPMWFGGGHLEYSVAGRRALVKMNGRELIGTLIISEAVERIEIGF